MGSTHVCLVTIIMCDNVILCIISCYLYVRLVLCALYIVDFAKEGANLLGGGYLIKNLIVVQHAGKYLAHSTKFSVHNNLFCQSNT